MRYISLLAVLSGLFLFTACGQATTFEQTYGSPKQVVAERYFPNTVDMVFTVDTRDAGSLEVLMDRLHMYIPQYVSADATLDSLLQQLIAYGEAHGEIPAELNFETELLPAFPRENRVVIAMDAPTTYTNGSPDMTSSVAYAAVQVGDLNVLDTLRKQLLASGKIEERSYKGVPYLVATDTSNLHMFLEKDLLLMATQEKGIQAMIDTISQKDTSLLRSRYFDTIGSRMKQKTLMTWYIDYAYIREMMKQQQAALYPEKQVRVDSAFAMPQFYFGNLYLTNAGIMSDGLLQIDEKLYREKGWDLKKASMSKSSVARALTSGHVLFASEYAAASDVVGGTLKGLLNPKEQSQMNVATNMIQNTIGLSWKEEIAPFFNLPSVFALVDHGEVLPGLDFLVDVRENTALGDKVAKQLIAAVDKAVAFGDGQADGEVSSRMIKDVLGDKGARFSFDISDLVIDSMGADVEKLSSQALASLKSLRIVFDVERQDTWVALRLGMNTSLPELSEDAMFQEFVQGVDNESRLGLGYVGVTAFAEYGKRVYDQMVAYGVWNQFTAEKAATYRAETETVLNRVVDIMNDFTHLEAVTRYEGNGVGTMRLAIPFAKAK